MAVNGERITVSTVSVGLNTEVGLVSGTRIIVKNEDATNAADLGDSAVTAGTGFRLAPGATVEVELTHGEQLFAIRSGAADVVLGVLRTGS